MLSVLYFLRMLKITLVTNRAVKSESETPTESVTANPLIGPVPNINKNRAVIEAIIKLCDDSNHTVSESAKHALRRLKSRIPKDMKKELEKYLIH